jgi:hypothetical protein
LIRSSRRGAQPLASPQTKIFSLGKPARARKRRSFRSESRRELKIEAVFDPVCSAGARIEEFFDPTGAKVSGSKNSSIAPLPSAWIEAAFDPPARWLADP